MAMQFWLPHTQSGSGSDVLTNILASGLDAMGHRAIPQAFPHNLQYVPWVLRRQAPPSGTDCIITNTWSGFALHRPAAANITVEHLFVLDPANRPYRSFAQAVFHEVLVRLFVKQSMRSADVTVAVSDYTARAVTRAFPWSQPRTITNGIDTDFFCPAEDDARLNAKADRPFRLLFVGNFTRRKGADLLPALMNHLGSDFVLEFTSGLRGRAEGRFPENMHCIGKLAPAQIRDAYRNADALLFPSRLEGLPLTLLEALACGTPAIVSDRASFSEVVDHGVTGLVCPADDVRAFGEAAQRLKADRNAWHRMATAARVAAVQRFSRQRMTSEYARLASEIALAHDNARAQA